MAPWSKIWSRRSTPYPTHHHHPHDRNGNLGRKGTNKRRAEVLLMFRSDIVKIQYFINETPHPSPGLLPRITQYHLQTASRPPPYHPQITPASPQTTPVHPKTTADHEGLICTILPHWVIALGSGVLKVCNCRVWGLEVFSGPRFVITVSRLEPFWCNKGGPKRIFQALSGQTSKAPQKASRRYFGSLQSRAQGLQS